MKLTARTDLDAPIGFVYDCLLDHASWEREAAERGIEVRHVADTPLSGPSSSWQMRLPYRGKLVTLVMQCLQVTSKERLDFALQTNTVEGELQFSLLALSPRRTRLHLSIDVRPRTLAARVFLNTLRLAKGRVEARLETRIKQVGLLIQNRYGKSRA